MFDFWLGFAFGIATMFIIAFSIAMWFIIQAANFHDSWLNNKEQNNKLE